MLTRETLLQIASNTCPGCQRPLGVYHAYPVTDPETLLTMLTNHAPRCRECATRLAEAMPAPADGRPHLVVVIVVKVSSIGMPSGRLLKLHPEDPETWRIHLFTPKEIEFRHPTPHDRAQMIRPATNMEAEDWVTPRHAAPQRYHGPRLRRAPRTHPPNLHPPTPPPQTPVIHPTPTHTAHEHHPRPSIPSHRRPD